MLAALAFVPLEDVVPSFEELVASIDFPTESLSIVEYFEDCWIGRPTINKKRKQPRYSHDLWNCHDSVLNDMPRTNNAVEGWHRGFSSGLSAHPTIFKLIDALKLEQSKNEMLLGQINSGVGPPHKRVKYRDNDERMKRIVMNYKTMPLSHFLKGISSNFNY